MKSNVANTTNRPDGLMTRLKDGVSKPLRTVILSAAAALAPDIAENVLPHSGGDPYALHAAERQDELARIDTNRNNQSTKTEVEALRTEAIDLISEYKQDGKLDGDTAEYLTKYVNDSKYFESRLTEADLDNLIEQEKALQVFEKDGNRFDD